MRAGARSALNGVGLRRSVEPLGVVSERKNHPKMLGCQEARAAYFSREGPMCLSSKDNSPGRRTWTAMR